ncbi:MAG: c-type cytochrome [Bacteroidetes bacterium]|jgi:cytochrome c oxidase cbb3-type subunit III|nr:c-type cytochrome [Bacteroidota bacterium]
MKTKSIKIALTLVCMLFMSTAFGQSLDDITAATESYESFGISLASVLYIFAIILVAIAGGMLLIAVHLKKYMKGELGEEYTKRQPFWEKVFQIKPVASDKDTVINHPHDGIYELDNPPPPWFMFLFYGTVIIAVIYYVRFTFTDSGYTQVEEYTAEMKAAEADHSKFLETAGDVVDETSVTLLTDEASLAKGATIYDANCKVCHGDYGQGTVGPNLTDKYWKYDGSIKGVFETVKYGRPGGMQAWAQNMGPESLQAIASYVISLEGTTLPDGIEGKAAEGDLFDRSSDDSEADQSASEESTSDEADTPVENE